jgi:hypothetical protein
MNNGTVLALSLLLALIMGLVATAIGILIFQPLFGAGIGLGLQMLLGGFFGWHCPAVARRILGVQ